MNSHNSLTKRPSDHSDNDSDDGREADPPISASGLNAKENRGKRAPRSGSGVVTGSGAGAGGAGGAEDFDSDAAGGGGAMPSPTDVKPKSGADAPVGGSR